MREAPSHNRSRTLLADPKVGVRIVRKADDGRRREAIQEIPVEVEQDMGADPYKILGVDRQATPEEVRAAYHKKAIACHPDTFVGDRCEAERLFREVTEAYRQILRERSTPVLSRIAVSPEDLAAMQMARSLMGKTVARKQSGMKNVRRFVNNRLREVLMVLIALLLLLVLLGCLGGILGFLSDAPEAG